MKVLVKFNKDWADEFDVDGWKIYNSMEDWQADLDTLDEVEYSFGTNEGWEQGEFEESDFSAAEITDEHAAVLVGLFGTEYGKFPF